MQVNIQPETGRPLCRLIYLSFLAALWYFTAQILATLASLNPHLCLLHSVRCQSLKFPLPDTQPGRCLSVGTIIGLAFLVPHPSRIIALHCVFPVSGNSCFIAFVWLFHHAQSVVDMSARVVMMSLGLPSGKELPASAGGAGDVGSIPRLGRFSGEGNGNPPQLSCLKNPMDRGAG